jgi:hypothetical protein
MAAITEGFVFGMLAAAPGNGLGRGDFRFDGRESGAFM